MEIFQFNSKDFPASLRSAEVESVWSESLLMDVDLRASPAPKFSMRACRLQSLSISSISGSASEMLRSHAQACAAGSELILCVSRDSYVKVQHCGKPESVFAPGEAHLWLGDMPTRCTVNNFYHAIMINIPTTALAQASFDIDQLLDKGIAPHASELKLLVSYVENFLYNLEHLGEQAACAAMNHIREMAALSLQPRSNKKNECSAKGNGRALRLRRIKADIQSNLNHPELSPAWLARREGISERYLRYLLADEQTHFSGLIAEMRLTQSYERLIDTRNNRMSVSSIAFSCGFNDLSYFYRIFKRRFGATPSEVRLNHQTG